MSCCVGAVDGGYITYANRDSGLLAKNNVFNATITPQNNSLYMMFGSYAEHGKNGTRTG